MRKWLALVFSLYACSASAQAVQQSGNITPGHVACWAITGVIYDCGTPGGSSIVGPFTANDLVAVNGSGSLIDSGINPLSTSNISALWNFNGGATAPTRPLGDNTTNVATTAFVQANTVYHSATFGAVGNGITDDTTALQAWINACQGSKSNICWLDPGTYLITSTLNATGTNSLVMKGVSPLESAIAPIVGVSALNCTNANPCYLRDFAIIYSAQANAATYAVQITAASFNQRSEVSGLHITNARTGIIIGNAIIASLHDNVIDCSSCSGSVGISFNNVNNPAIGDSGIYNNTINLPGATTGVYATAYSGIRFVGNKIVGTAVAGSIGIDLELQSAGCTACSDLLISSNSIEAMVDGIKMARLGTTGSFGLVNIIGNEIEFEGNGHAVYNPQDATGTWLAYLNISGNLFYGPNNGTNYCVYLYDVTYGTVTGNTCIATNTSGSMTPFFTSGSVVGVMIGANSVVNQVSGSGTLNNDSVAAFTGASTSFYNEIKLTDPFTNFQFLQSAGGTGYRWILNNDGSIRLQYSTTGFSSVAATPIIVDTSQKVNMSSLLLDGSSSGIISILPQTAAGTYNFNLPITAGSAGQTLTSQGGGSTVMTWVTPGQIIPLSSNGAVAQNSTVFEVSAQSGTEATAAAMCPRAGTFKNLYILTGTIGGSAQTVTATMRANAGDSSVTCQIATGSTTCNDTTHTATCTAGQSYSLKVVTSATTGSVTSVNGGIEFDPN